MRCRETTLALIVSLMWGCKDHANPIAGVPLDTDPPTDIDIPLPANCNGSALPVCDYTIACEECFDSSEYYENLPNTNYALSNFRVQNFGCEQAQKGIPFTEMWNVDYEAIRSQLVFWDGGSPVSHERSDIEQVFDVGTTSWNQITGSELEMEHRYDDGDLPGPPITQTIATVQEGFSLSELTVADTFPFAISAGNLANETLFYAQVFTCQEWDPSDPNICLEMMGQELNWTLFGVEPNTVSFEEVLIHEMGHAVGLEHSFDSDSIMWEARDEDYPREVEDSDEHAYSFMYVNPSATCP